MRVKVELAPDVWDSLRYRLSPAERDSFVAQLEEARRAPIKNSEASRDPQQSEYMLRFFRFGSGRWIAVFECDIRASRMRVLKCRLLKPSRRRGRVRDDRGQPE
jgi:hypothetical protein